MSITHIEELEPTEFINTLRTIQDYRITEKVDGSQLLFGIDGKGFYTSRETKGGRRIYSVDDYENTFSNRYKRSAHILLERVLPVLRAAGLRPGDQVEAEVLYGAVPNVVPYSADTNYLIFLRTTKGSVNIDNLKQKLDGQTLSISLLSPYTDTGVDIQYRTETNVWRFDSVPEIQYDFSHIRYELNHCADSLEEWLQMPSGLHSGGTRYEVFSTKLNKIPQWFDNKNFNWRRSVPAIENVRHNIREIVEIKMLEAKRLLIDEMVSGKPSRFGRLDGWIEGVVLHNPETDHTVKLVDKNTFGKARLATWRQRIHLSKITKNTAFTSRELLIELDKYKRGSVYQRDLEAFADLFQKIGR